MHRAQLHLTVVVRQHETEIRCYDKAAESGFRCYDIQLLQHGYSDGIEQFIVALFTAELFYDVIELFGVCHDGGCTVGVEELLY